MAYCTVGEVLDMLKADMMNVIIGDDYIEDEQERIKVITPLAEQAVGDAEAEIDGYLAKRYKVPFVKTPQVINKFAKDIALYNLVSRKGIDESEREKTYLTRYNSAITFLTKVAEGKIDIGVSEKSIEDAAKNGFSMKNAKRLFTRESAHTDFRHYERSQERSKNHIPLNRHFHECHHRTHHWCSKCDCHDVAHKLGWKTVNFLNTLQSFCDQ